MDNNQKLPRGTLSKKTTSDWTHNEFCEWAFQQVFDGLVTGGLRGVRNAIRYSVVQECTRLMHQGGFKEKSL